MILFIHVNLIFGNVLLLFSTSPFGESNTHCDYNVVTSSTPTAILISTASVEEEAKATKTKVGHFVVTRFFL